MEDIIDEGCEPPTSVRNGTDLSRFCDGLMRRFLKSGAEHALIRVDRTEYDLGALYKGLWNASCKADYRGRVTVHRQDEKLYLIRKKVK